MKRLLRLLSRRWRQFRDPLYCAQCDKDDMRLPWRGGINDWVCVSCDLTPSSPTKSIFIGR